MTDPKSIPKNCAGKIEKWLDAAVQLQQGNLCFALPITRLTSIKSLCCNQEAARAFALHMGKQVCQQIQLSEQPERFTPEEWQHHLTLASDAVLAIETKATDSEMWALLQRIESFQGNNVQRVKWTTVHWVNSGELLKLEYALRCCMKTNYSDWAYKLARECVECYSGSWGSGLTPDSIPMLLNVAEFWCCYYFGRPLVEKFPKFLQDLEFPEQSSSSPST